MSKIDYATADDLVRTLVDLSYKKYGSYSYAAGALQSQLAMLLAYGDREQAVRDLNRLIIDVNKK
jgi:hypothetical protein